MDVDFIGQHLTIIFQLKMKKYNTKLRKYEETILLLQI